MSPTRGTALRQNRSAAVVESAASQAHCLCPEDCLAGQRKRQTLQRPHPLAPVVDERSKRLHRAMLGSERQRQLINDAGRDVGGELGSLFISAVSLGTRRCQGWIRWWGRVKLAELLTWSWW